MGTTVGRFKEASSYGSRGDVEHVLPFGGPFLTAELSVVVVGRQSVVPAALNVQRDQVQAELGRPLEEPVAHLRSMETLGFYSVARRSRKAHLVGEGHVHALRRLDDQTAHQRLDAVLFVEFERLELVPVQLQVLHLGSERRERPGGGRDQSSTAQTDEKKHKRKLGDLLDESLHQRVAHAEGRRGEFVGDGRVDGGVVQVVVASAGRQRFQTERRHVRLACNRKRFWNNPLPTQPNLT